MAIDYDGIRDALGYKGDSGGSDSSSSAPAWLQKELDRQAAEQEPWNADPLQAIPDPTDQLVYFDIGYLIIKLVIFAIFFYGIWRLYLAIREKDGGGKFIGIAEILVAMILNGLHMSFGVLRPYLQQADVSSLNPLQGMELSIASWLYGVSGTTNGAGANPVVMGIIIVVALALPIGLITLIVGDIRKRKAEEHQREVDALSARIDELEDKLKES